MWLRVCGIQADRRLVEEQDPGRVHQAARDLEPPLHAARERAHETAPAVAELDHLEHLVEARAIY